MAASIKSKLLFPFFLILALIVTSCGQPAPATPAVDMVATIVAATMQALTPQAPLATPTAPVIPSAVATFTPITANTSAANTGVPTITATPGMGALQGSVTGYPYGAIPKLIFVAFNQENGHWNYLINAAGLNYYSMDLLAGKYQIVAYDASGHAGGCKTIVTVKANETANCDITDWIGLYPAKPGDAPNP